MPADASMLVGLKHTHTLLVTLFMISIWIKTFLLLTSKNAALASYRKKTLVPEMVISLLFVVLGIIMLIQMPVFLQTRWFITKLILVIAVIPLSIIAFKKENKALAALSSLILLYVFLLAFSKALTLFL